MPFEIWFTVFFFLPMDLSHKTFCRFSFKYVIARLEESLLLKQVKEESNDRLVTPPMGW